jgi:hypothetical protein
VIGGTGNWRAGGTLACSGLKEADINADEAVEIERIVEEGFEVRKVRYRGGERRDLGVNLE